MENLRRERKLVTFISKLLVFVMVVGMIMIQRPEKVSAGVYGKTAMQITQDMGAGWNLGNSLESSGGETNWGNPRTNKAMIDAIKNKGFRTIRIPVRWDENYTNKSTFTINPNYLKRVKEVVDYAYNNNMYVIINVHHNAIQQKVTTEWWQKQQIKNELKAIWTQVGKYFESYDQKLIFETFNEPRQGDDWNGNSGLYNAVNECNEEARAAIRATGGNNKNRLVMMPTYCASSDAPKMDAWKKIGNDNMVAASIHAYVPFNFAFNGYHTQWNDNDKNELWGILNRIKTTFIDKGIPVVIGEFGASNFGNDSSRLTYARTYAQMAKGMQMPVVWWDNNAFKYGQENFGIFDRNTMRFRGPDIANELVSVYGKRDPSQSSNGGNQPTQPSQPTQPAQQHKEITLFNSVSSSKPWGQALEIVTKKNGGWLDPYIMTPNGYFYVEYSGYRPSCIEFILQSWSGGAKWVKVKRSKTVTINGHYFAKFKYSDVVAAYGSNNFSTLDKVYVGASNQYITVYNVKYCQ